MNSRKRRYARLAAMLELWLEEDDIADDKAVELEKALAPEKRWFTRQEIIEACAGGLFETLRRLGLKEQ